MRLTPLPAEEWDDRVRASLAGLVPRKRQDPDGAGPLLSTIVRHPDLAKVLFPFSTYLLTHSTLPPRLRECVVLRVARRHDSKYEWVSHAKFARSFGLSEEEIEAASEGRSDDAATQLALTAVEELHERSDLTDGTWDALHEHFDERQRIDLVFTICGYLMLSVAFNTFGIEP